MQRVLRGTTYFYELPIRGVARQFLVTVQSNPLILHGEIDLYFRVFSVVKEVVEKSPTSSHQNDSGLKCIIFLLN